MNPKTKRPGGMFAASDRAKASIPDGGSSMRRRKACPREKRKDGRAVNGPPALLLGNSFRRAPGCRPPLGFALAWVNFHAMHHLSAALAGRRDGASAAAVSGSKLDSYPYTFAAAVLVEAEPSAGRSTSTTGAPSVPAGAASFPLPVAGTAEARTAALSCQAAAGILQHAAAEQRAKCDTRSRLHDLMVSAIHGFAAESCLMVAAQLRDLADELETPARRVPARRQRGEVA